MASRIARNTENGSSSGGSPTAFERWIESATLRLLKSFTVNASGQSDTPGIL